MKPKLSIPVRKPARLPRWTADELRAIHRRVLRGRYADGVLHTINNMVMVILAHCDELRDRLPESDANRPRIDELELAAEQIGAATAGFVPLMGDGSHPVKPVPLAALATRASAMLRGLLPRAIAIEAAPCTPAEPWALDLGESRALQALIGLGGVVREALPRGGDLRLTIEPPKHQSRSRLAKATLEARGEGNAAAVLGTPRTPPSPETALALWGVGDLAARAGGLFRAARATGKGLRLTLELPCSLIEPGSGSTAPLDGKVLLAAGDDYSRALAASVLRAAGCEAGVYPSAGRALAYWPGEGGGPRLLLVDGASLKGLATEKLEQIARLGKTMQVAIICGEGRRSGGPLAAIPLRLIKPFSMGDLTALARRAFEFQRRKPEKEG